MKKIYSIYLLLGLFIATLYSCREDLTPVGPDIAEITHFRHDGPYLFYGTTALHMKRHLPYPTFTDVLTCLPPFLKRAK